MAVTIGVKREFEFTANDPNGDPCLFPRDPRNPVFAQAFNFVTKQIAYTEPQYLAFPYVTKIGTSLIGIYSDGDAHASADRQIMIRSDDNGLTWSSVVFYVSATGVFDYSLLTGVLTAGNKAVFKVWTVTNTAGVFSSVANSSISYGGLNYAPWSRAITGPGGKLYRTGYATNGADTQTALLESSDGGNTWSGKAVMFSGVGRLYGEADLINTTGTNWLAICREDAGASNNLYSATSADDGATWSAATLLTVANINGRQPNLTKLTDNSIILATGDRTGASGYGGSAGDQVSGFDTTGITIFRTTDNGATWSFRTRVAPIFSTDGGQPMVNETSTANRINVVFYGRRTTKQSPVIASVTLDAANL